MNQSSGANASANRYLYLLIIIAAAARVLLLFGSYEYCVRTFLPQLAGVSPNR